MDGPDVHRIVRLDRRFVQRFRHRAWPARASWLGLLGDPEFRGNSKTPLPSLGAAEINGVQRPDDDLVAQLSETVPHFLPVRRLQKRRYVLDHNDDGLRTGSPSGNDAAQGVAGIGRIAPA